MSSPSEPQPQPQPDAGPSEWYCHACSVTTREPISDPSSGALLCPACRSDFLEQLDAADDPRRLSEWPAELQQQQQQPIAVPLGGGPHGAGAGNPFAAMLSQILGGAQQQRAPTRQDTDAAQQHEHPDEQGQEGHGQGHGHGQEGGQPLGGVTFTFMTSGVDQDGNRVTTTHAGPQPQPQPQEEQRQPQEEQPQPQSLTDFLNQAFQGNPNPHAQPAEPQQGQQQPPQGEAGQRQRPTPTSLAGLLGAMLGGQGGPALVHQGPGGMQFIFNSTFGPMHMGGDEPPMQWGDALNERGLDNFITALMNQAQANQEGPRRAPEEMISSLPRKHLSPDDIAAFRHAECAICKDDFHPDDDVITLECDHVFHADCIVPWLERSGTCAVCRHELVEQPGTHRPPPQPQPRQESQPESRPHTESQPHSDAPDPPDASPPSDQGHDHEHAHGQPHFHVHTAGGGPMPPVFSLIGDLFGQIFPGQQFPGQQPQQQQQQQQHSGQQQPSGQQQAQQPEQQSRQGEEREEHPPEQEPLD